MHSFISHPTSMNHFTYDATFYGGHPVRSKGAETSTFDGVLFTRNKAVFAH